MLAISSGTYAKLTKVYTGTAAECRTIVKNQILDSFPRGDVKEITRGENRIGYYRPDGGRCINDKIYMLHWNKDGTVSLWL